MNSKKIIIAIISLSSLLVVGVFIAFIIMNKDNRDWEYFDIERDISSIVHVEVSLFNEDDIVFVVDTDYDPFIRGSFHIPSHYILGERRVGRSIDGMTGEVEFQQLDNVIYDLLSGEEVKVIDVLEMMEEFEELLEGYRILSLSPTVRRLESGEVYLVWRFSNKDIFDDHSIQHIRMNYETGEISFHNYEVTMVAFSSENDRELHIKLGFFRGSWIEGDDSLPSFYYNNGIIVNESSAFRIYRDAFLKESAIVRLSSDNLPLDSESLYNRFPGLREFQGADGLEINLRITEHLTAEEVFELFMEDGHEIVFDGLVISGDYSIDGEEHEINSFEDYFRLRDFSWLDEEEQSENDDLN